MMFFGGRVGILKICTCTFSGGNGPMRTCSKQEEEEEEQ